MLKLRKHPSKKFGLPQGTLVHIGEKFSDEVYLNLIKYSMDGYEKFEIKEVSECIKLRDDSSIVWLNVVGIHDSSLIRQIGSSFQISDLTLEEIMNANKHPKIERFKEYFFVIARIYFYHSSPKKANFENISIILGKNFVITFQEKENDLFKPIIDRIEDQNSLLRTRKSDYLFCSILDLIVDQYFLAMDHIGNKIERIESRIISRADEKLLKDVYDLRQEVSIFSKILRPEREILSSILHERKDLILEETVQYIHDVYEHTIHLIEVIDSYRDNITALHELYLSTISTRMNDVMKTLTIVASLFIPITFVAGIYGMNFEYMPELSSPLGYPLALISMAIIPIALFYQFRKKKWV